MTLLLKLNIGLKNELIFLLSLPRYVTYMNNNTQVYKNIEIVLLK